MRSLDPALTRNGGIASRLQSERTMGPVLALVGVVTGIGLLAWRSSLPAGSDDLGVGFTGQTTNAAGVRLSVLQITNRSSERICLPDSCSVQSRGAANAVATPTDHLWLKPGEVASLPVPAPNRSGDWRVAVGYYPEGPWNRFKQKLSASSLGPKLPAAVVSVNGAVVWSPWIPQ